MERLDISNNKISRLPKELFDSKKLKHINISHNQLKDLPNELIKIPTLEIVDISYNNIDRRKTFANLTPIKIINRYIDTYVDIIKFIPYMMIILISAGLFIVLLIMFIHYIFDLKK